MPSEILSVLGVTVTQVSLYGFAGLLIGIAGRRWLPKDVFSWRFIGRVLKALFTAIVVAFPALIVVVAILLRGCPMYEPPPRGIEVERVAFVYATSARWVVDEQLEIPWHEAIARCTSASQHFTTKSGWEVDRARSFPHQDRWTLRRQRLVSAAEPRGRFTYIQTIPFESVHFEPSLIRCIDKSQLWFEQGNVRVTLHAPALSFQASDPPADVKTIPRQQIQLETALPSNGALSLEMVHPWLRNDLGAVVLDWNVFAVLKWLALAICAVFSDRIRERFLVPLGRVISDSFKRKRRPAGF